MTKDLDAVFIADADGQLFAIRLPERFEIERVRGVNGDLMSFCNEIPTQTGEVCL